MSIADSILHGTMPDLSQLHKEGLSLDDTDEYGFTPLIESIISGHMPIGKSLVEAGASVQVPDVGSRSPLHWTVDNNDLKFSHYLLQQGADPNAYTREGLSVLVYPLLREHRPLKQILYQYGAKLDFPLDFILGKLIGHRFELKGMVDIVDPKGDFIELNYEGFILEFTVAILHDALRRFMSSYSTRTLRDQFTHLYPIMDSLSVASELLKFQHIQTWTPTHTQRLEQYLSYPLLILPAASRGHAIGFIRFKDYWAKIDRGENSLKEGSVNIYHITKPAHFDIHFLKNTLYKKQERAYFHEKINEILGLKPITTFPMTQQITGNCSWANIQAAIPTAMFLGQLAMNPKAEPDDALELYAQWLTWDQARALDDCIHRFYLANPVRKASLAAMLGGILFQACDASNPEHCIWAEKILRILTQKEYYYILESYLTEYCVNRLTFKGNNLLKLLEDVGFDPNIGVTPIATPLTARD